MTRELPLTPAVVQPRQPSTRPPLLILLHGYGANEDDLAGLAPHLDPRLLLVCPRAPLTLQPGSYVWFNLGFDADGISFDAAEVQRALIQVTEFVAAAASYYQADPARLVLGGFSQGAIVSAALLQTAPELLAGVALLSGRVPHAELAGRAPDAALRGKPVLIQHGVHDQVLPVEGARAGRALLEPLGVALTYREYPMGHEISAQSLSDFAAWLAARL